MLRVLLNPLVILMLCLSLGFLLGRVKMRFFPANSTLATLVVAIIVNIVVRKFFSDSIQPLSLASEIQTLSFAFFSFVVGFSAGPNFWATVKDSGLKALLKQMLMPIAFCVFAFVAACAVLAVCKGGSQEQFCGLLAGALSQSTILEAVSRGGDPVAYGVAYIPGLIMMILFVQTIAPRILGISLLKSVKNHIDATRQTSSSAVLNIPAYRVQMRAYRIKKTATGIGTSIGEIEASAARRIEVVAVYPRAGEPLVDIGQMTRLNEGDVFVIIGDIRSSKDLTCGEFEEMSDERFHSEKIVFADIVLADERSGVFEALTGKGLLLRSIVRSGRILSEESFSELRGGDVLRVSGFSKNVDQFAREFGYLREESAPTDFVWLTFAIGIALILGSLSFGLVSLGAGCCALITGLILGCLNQRRPDVAHLPPAILLFLRSIGLNLFIAVMALNAKLVPEEVFSLGTLLIVFKSMVVVGVPVICTLLFGHYVLRLSPVVLLGGICGCGTCTPALNALEEETGSSVFTAAYTIPYVVANVLLTLMGCLAVRLVG